MLLDIFYTVVDRRTGIIPPSTETAYHEFTFEAADNLPPFQQGMSIAFDIARRVDLSSFTIKYVYCFAQGAERSYRIVQVSRNERKPAWEALSFDEAIEIIRGLLTPNGRAWRGGVYQIEPEDASSWLFAYAKTGV